jgi:hypothetical protein
MFTDASRTGTKNIGARSIPSTDEAFKRRADCQKYGMPEPDQLTEIVKLQRQVSALIENVENLLR